MLKFFLDVISEPVFLGAFLGFVSTLGAEGIIRALSNRNQRKKLLQALNKELEGVSNKVDKLSKKDKDYESQPYSIPIWNSACITGTIGLLSKNKELYKEYTEIFLFIQELNLFERECFYRYVFQNCNIAVDYLRKYRETLKERTRKFLENSH